MTLYAIYTPAKQELATEKAITDLGIRAECAKRVDLVRQGYRRWPDIVKSSLLPNYVFAWLTAADWHEVVKVKTVRDLMGIGPKWGARAEEWLASVNGEYRAKLAEYERITKILEDRDTSNAHKRKAWKEARAAVAEYKAGDSIRVLDGPFEGFLARFRRMVEDANAIHPQIEVDLEIFGRTSIVRLDPLIARKIG